MTKRWEKGASGMLTVNSIFAGFSGTLLYNISNEHIKAVSPWLLYPDILFSIFAIYCFIKAAEKITDALDEDKPRKYLHSMMSYNLGVFLILLSLTLYLFHRNLPCVVAALPIFLSFHPWLFDIWFLKFGPKQEKHKYFVSLLQDVDAKSKALKKKCS